MPQPHTHKSSTMPAKAGSRRRASQSTKYSVNFNALPDNASDASSLFELHHNAPLDVIHTDDIDGPTDFTQNMELWMRGDFPSKESRKDQIFEQVNELATEDSKANAEKGVSVNNAVKKGEQNDSVPNHSRRSSLSSLAEQEKVLSYLETLGDAEIPDIRIESPRTTRNARSVRSLQPTVEDFETPRKSSAGTAIHVSSQNLESPHKDMSSRITELEEELRRQTEEAESALAKLRQQLSSTRTELDQAVSGAQLRQKELDSLKDDHAVRIQVLGDDWEQKLADVNRRNDAAIENATKNHLSEKDVLEKRIEQLESQVDHEVQTRQSSHEATLLAHEQEIGRWEARLDSKVTSHSEEVLSLRQQLDKLKADQESSQAELRKAHSLAMEKQRAEYDERIALLTKNMTTVQPIETPDATSGKSETSSSPETSQQLAIIKKELESARIDILRKDADIMAISEQKGRAEANLASSRALVADLQDSVSRLEDDLDRAREELSDAQLRPTTSSSSVAPSSQADTRAAALTADLAALKSAHATELAASRTRAEAAVRKIGALLDAEKTTSAALRADLDRAQQAQRDAGEELGRARAEADALRDDYESVNAAMDERVLALIRERETVWRERVARLEGERAQMGRALMREWGRREVGKGVGEKKGEQPYRYKYAVDVEGS